MEILLDYIQANLQKVYDKAPYGKILIDGNIGVDEDAKSIKERRNLASNGFLHITIIIGNKGEILDLL